MSSGSDQVLVDHRRDRRFRDEPDDPVDGLTEAMGVRPTHVPFWMLLGAIAGGGFTYWLEWYSAVIDYPINIGGRPPFSWPAFLPPALEMTLLWAVLLGVLAMLIGNRLPRVHHPLFAVRAFDRAVAQSPDAAQVTGAGPAPSVARDDVAPHLVLSGVGKDYAKVTTRAGRVRLVWDLIRGRGARQVFHLTDNLLFCVAQENGHVVSFRG